MWDMVNELKKKPPPPPTGYAREWKPKPKNKYTHWPQPFGKVQDLEVLACNPTPYVRARVWGQAFTQWWFANFIPSPTELYRNWLTGRYRCGMKFEFPAETGRGAGPRMRGPLDIIWTDGRASLVAAETLRPVLTGLWYLWATGTAWDALQRASSVIAAIEACDDGIEEVVLAHGEGDFYYDGNAGSPTSYQTIHDPYDRYQSPNSFFTHLDGPISSYAFGDITAVSQTVDYWSVELTPDDLPATKVEGGTINPGEVVNWSVEGGASHFRTSAIGIRVVIVQHGSGLAPTVVHVKRWLSSTRPYQPNPSGDNFPYLSPRCSAPDLPTFYIGGTPTESFS